MESKEEKVAALVSGSKLTARALQSVMDAALAGGTDMKANADLASAVHEALPWKYRKLYLPHIGSC